MAVEVHTDQLSNAELVSLYARYLVNGPDGSQDDHGEELEALRTKILQRMKEWP